MPLERDPEAMELRYLQEYADLAGARVLEIGCGEGRLIWRYVALVDHVVGIDLDPTRLTGAVRDCPSAFRDRLRLLCGQAEKLPFPEAVFNRVILGWSL